MARVLISRADIARADSLTELLEQKGLRLRPQPPGARPIEFGELPLESILASPVTVLYCIHTEVIGIEQGPAKKYG